MLRRRRSLLIAFAALLMSGPVVVILLRSSNSDVASLPNLDSGVLELARIELAPTPRATALLTEEQARTIALGETHASDALAAAYGWCRDRLGTEWACWVVSVRPNAWQFSRSPRPQSVHVLVVIDDASSAVSEHLAVGRS